MELPFYIRQNYLKCSTAKVLIDVDCVFPIFLLRSFWDEQWNLNSEGKSSGSRNTGQQASPIFVVSTTCCIRGQMYSKHIEEVSV